MIRVAVDWDDTCRDNSVSEFRWCPGALEALEWLNANEHLHVFILTARPPKGTISIQYQLQAHRLHNISVKASPKKHEMHTKPWVRWDLLIDDDDWFDGRPDVVKYEGRHSWNELRSRAMDLRIRRMCQ